METVKKIKKNKNKNKNSDTLKKAHEVKILNEVNGNAKTIMTCYRCQKQKVIGNFWRDTNNEDGYMHYCKDCICDMCIDSKTKLFTKTNLVNYLKMSNRPYVHKIWNTVKHKPYNETKKVGEYFRLIGSIGYKNRTFEDSDSEINAPDTDIIDLEADKKEYSIVWGGNFTKLELESLDNMYKGYEKNFNLAYEHDKALTRMICKEKLRVDKLYEDLQNGKIISGEYTKALESYSNLCRTAKFSPSDRKENGGFNNYSKTFENVEQNIWIPVYKPSEAEKDIYDTLLEQLQNIKRSL